jgi:hypothetical protein
VARFTRQDEPARRASVDYIYPEREVTLAESVEIMVPLEGSSALRRARVIHRGGGQHAVVYWHQIARRTYGDGYSFRWALMRRAIFDRRGDSVLVRIAVPLDRMDRDAALAGIAELGPPLHAALARLLGE